MLLIGLGTFIFNRNTHFYEGVIEEESLSKRQILEMYDFSIFYVDSYNGKIICGNLTSREEDRHIVRYQVYGKDTQSGELREIFRLENAGSTCHYAFRSGADYFYKELVLTVEYDDETIEEFSLTWHKVA